VDMLSILQDILSRQDLFDLYDLFDYNINKGLESTTPVAADQDQETLIP
jgi:hypothetical protein